MSKQVSSDKEITPEQVHPYPTAAPSTSKRGGRDKGKSRILTLTPEKERIETLAAKRKASGTLNSKTKRKPKTFIKKLGPYKTNSKSSDSNFTIHDESMNLMILQRKLDLNLKWVLSLSHWSQMIVC
jgi:hypothetical protein